MTAPPPGHLQAVQRILEQFSEPNLEDYLPALQAPGYRLSHYHREYTEATLTFDLSSLGAPLTYIQEFTDRVNRQLGDLFVWFQPESWHVTIRALRPQDQCAGSPTCS